MARPFDLIPPRIQRLDPASGPARLQLFMIHGAWRGNWTWEGLVGPLADAGYGLNMLELPGHGADAWPLPGFSSLQDYADYALRALDQVPNSVLVGHSMGGWIVQKILETQDLPAALLAPLPGRGLPWPGLMRFIMDHPRQAWLNLTGRPVSFESDAREVGEPWRVTMEMALGLVRARPRAGRSPRLVLAGERDRLVPPRSAARLANRLGAEFVLCRDVGHMLWSDEARHGVIKELFEFLAGLESGGQVHGKAGI